MATDEMMMGAGMAPEDELAVEDLETDTTEPEAPIGTTIVHSIEEVPELANLAVGDTVSMVISEITDDGQYTLEINPVEGQIEATATEQVPGGDLASALTGA